MSTSRLNRNTCANARIDATESQSYAETGKAQFGRAFNQARKDQGFRSQNHLDAFYAYMDHAAGCAECHKPGKGFELEDGSIQPTQNRCALAQQLFSAWNKAA